MKTLHSVLETMRLDNGAYTASTSEEYSYVWIRDVVYCVLPYLQTNCTRYTDAFYALFDLFRRYEWKLDIHTQQKPAYLYEHIHARYNKDLTERMEPWGHAQNDSIGLFLWGVGEGVRVGKRMFRDAVDRAILQKLVNYLQTLEYWEAYDNGMWEENMEVHASSVGACVAGLRAVKMLAYVPDWLIENGERTLRQLLPRESVTKESDLALLSLIYPYQLVDRNMAKRILSNITGQLERTFGVIRYKHDLYYRDEQEAEWCFGFPWLGMCYAVLGEDEMARAYWTKTQRVLPEDGRVPELYIGGKTPNGNTPLAWSVAMTMLLKRQITKEEIPV
ncbi:glycoside hydrolase family 15 protein [Tumebacillus flagellatus]|uniref:Glycoside hydrolase family 15 n=1 Tax=Tumebacillus flagellatus TaxID=1157490 RepID=A0A074LWJ4_9BACL|nr:glycoside hydrolase family 15 protein [Tumebacillus flagellatus]KEO85254.1 glycoside hydrolase family 15 [Tumebacillus flagellatus]